MKCCVRLLWVFFLLPACLSAQDITGIWRGHFRENTPPGQTPLTDDRYRIEVQIAQQKTAFEAVTYSYLSNSFYGKASANGTVNPRSKKVLLRELKLVELRMLAGSACMMTYFLQYSQLNDDEYLSGNYTSTSANDSTKACGKGTVFLHRVLNSDFYKEPFVAKREEELAHKKNPHKDSVAAPLVKTTPKKIIAKKPAATVATANPKTVPAKTPPKSVSPKPATALARPTTKPSNQVAKNTAKPLPKPPVSKPAPTTRSVTITPEQRRAGGDSGVTSAHREFPKMLPAVLTTRSNELVKSLTVDNEILHLSIYDDGAVDNDTVSVYLDNRLLIAHARISDAAIQLDVKIDQENAHELVMVADNLGDFPPNTSLMVIHDGEKTYEVRIVSNEQKNAVIRFSRKKP